jgi:hypothetical protein
MRAPFQGLLDDHDTDAREAQLPSEPQPRCTGADHNDVDHRSLRPAPGSHDCCRMRSLCLLATDKPRSISGPPSCAGAVSREGRTQQVRCDAPAERFSVTAQLLTSPGTQTTHACQNSRCS